MICVCQLLLTSVSAQTLKCPDAAQRLTSFKATDEEEAEEATGETAAASASAFLTSAAVTPPAPAPASFAACLAAFSASFCARRAARSSSVGGADRRFFSFFGYTSAISLTRMPWNVQFTTRLSIVALVMVSRSA